MIRIERSPLKTEWDTKAKRAIKEIPVFFPKWRALKNIDAFYAEVYQVIPSREGSVVIKALCDEILGDPLYEVNTTESTFPPEKADPQNKWWCLEKFFRAGVTDNPGHVLSEAIQLVTGVEAKCFSGSRLWLKLPNEISFQEVDAYAKEVFSNTLIERVEVWDEATCRSQDANLFQATTSKSSVFDGEVQNLKCEQIDIRGLSLDELEQLSQQRLWALSRQELSCVKAHYESLGRPMTDVEIEVIAQTWSEHCKHKIFAANIEVTNERTDFEVPNKVQSVFKTYIRGATREIPASYLKSVFEDNAGVISITKEIDCAIKVETHNSPSALDPYGGALTGIVGVNRDILGVGLGADPIANLDVFCVGDLQTPEPLPPRLHHPRRILEGVRMGVEDGGNKSGIPTVTGAVVHHPGYLGKPLVFCGTIGTLPTNRDLIRKEILDGDQIVMVGGRIGKDGIHGATFSSLEMNQDSPVSAVQLGDPLTQKRVWDFLIEARDEALFRAVTDNGAGGLSSSIGELARLCGKKGGARMDVARAATKYPGLAPYELVVSESQERMSFAVGKEKLSRFLSLAQARGVECSVLGEFVDTGKFHILYDGKTVADLEMEFLHDGLPPMELKARVVDPQKNISEQKRLRFGAWQALGNRAKELSLKQALPSILALPNVRSRRSITEQYDHEVGARSVRKPYGTPKHAAPNDGATLRISRTGFEGIAVGLGLAPFAAEIDSKVAAELALDEALRNAAVAGMDPEHAALVDNFCWPDPVTSPTNLDGAEKLGALVVTCKRIFEGAVSIRMPFISGKDSMKNDYRMGDVKISVPPTLLITAMGKVQDVRKVPKGFVSTAQGPLSMFWVSGQNVIPNSLGLPEVDFEKTAKFLKVFHGLICDELIESTHDVGDGGWLSTSSEILFGSETKTELDLAVGDQRFGEPQWAALFGEPATSFVLVVLKKNKELVRQRLHDFTVFEAGEVGPISHGESPSLSIRAKISNQVLQASWTLAELEQAYGVRL